jgi:hypothetical protein
VQGGCPVGSTCANIITTNPLLGALGNYGGSTQTIPLLPGSSAIDAGNDATCAATDQRGVARPQPIGGRCDIGAYEVQTILLAAPGSQTSGLCNSWANACELRYALTSAVSGQEIWVATGTYTSTMGVDWLPPVYTTVKSAAGKYTSITGTDRAATFQLKNGVALYGGFAMTETARSQRSPAVNVTILSGDLNGDDIGFTNNSENVYHVVTGVTGATLDGFTITAGNADDTANPNDSGGGMYNNGSSPILTNVTFSGNSATYGGGMCNISGSPTLTNVTFSGNLAINGYGGGMFNNSSSPTIRNTIFWGNTATAGSQIWDNSSTPSVSDSVVQDGYAGGTNIITADPLLGTLGDYGGSTPTIPLLPGSSAIDAGDNATCATTDQRGQARDDFCSATSARSS